ALADRILTGPELVRRGFREDRDFGRSEPVTIVERASAAKRDAHRLEVVAADPTVLDERRVARLPGIARLEGDLAVPPVLIHRQVAGQANPGDAWDRNESRQELPIEVPLTLAVAVARSTRRQIERHESLRGKARLLRLEADQILDEQSGAYEQAERE